MRRAAALMVILGFTVTGTWAGASGTAPAAVAAGHGAGVLRTGWVAGIGRTKLVRFAGYAVEVPVSWPVYRLATDPARCVRYDRPAVYLGPPGANQQCPAHLAGRVATLALEPAGQIGALPGGNWRPAAPTWAPPVTGNPTARQRDAATLSVDTWDRQLRAVFGRRGLAVTATYGASASLVLRILGTVRWTGPGRQAAPGATPAATRASAFPQPAASAAATAADSAFPQPAASATATAADSAFPQPAASARATAAVRPAARARHVPGRHRCLRHHCPRCHHRCHRCHSHCLRLPVKGFDTCAAPSLHAMWAWRHAFRAAAIYLGGPEAACGWGNLSAAWVRATVQMGWALLPIYVGPQAPCTGFGVRIQPGYAEAEGRAAASAAMGLASQLGIGRHAPIYDDMEAYDGRRAGCRQPVLAFLDGWTRALRSHGYTTGVYSSASAAARDLGLFTTVYGHPLAKPNSLWFGLWDGVRNVRGRPYLRNVWWAGHRRIKQYKGPRWRRIGGVKLNIDRDQVNGATYR